MSSLAIAPPCPLCPLHPATTICTSCHRPRSCPAPLQPYPSPFSSPFSSDDDDDNDDISVHSLLLRYRRTQSRFFPSCASSLPSSPSTSVPTSCSTPNTSPPPPSIAPSPPRELPQQTTWSRLQNKKTMKGTRVAVDIVEMAANIDGGSSRSGSPVENEDEMLDREGAWFLGSELMSEIVGDSHMKRIKEGEYRSRWGVIGEEVLRGEIGMPKAGKGLLVWEGVIERLEKGAMEETVY